MKHLHAYWRMDYIQAPKPLDVGTGASPFVTALESGDDRSNLILYRGPLTFLILNRFPYNAGHLLALPNREVAELEDLEAKERYELLDRICHGKDILQRALTPDGFNIGFNFGRPAGAGIPSHLHAHIVPRWGGDTNFLPVLSDTRVLPLALDAMWERLKGYIDD